MESFTSIRQKLLCQLSSSRPQPRGGERERGGGRERDLHDDTRDRDRGGEGSESRTRKRPEQQSPSLSLGRRATRRRTQEERQKKEPRVKFAEDGNASVVVAAEQISPQQNLKRFEDFEFRSEIPKGKAQCPICGILVSEALISGHVDVCLERQELRSSRGFAGGSPSFSTSGRERRVSGGLKLQKKEEPRKLPKLVYHVMKEKELRKYLLGYSLPVHGDRKVSKSWGKEAPPHTHTQLSLFGFALTPSYCQTQVNRLKEFVHHYNARIDSGNPITFKEASSKVVREEKIRAAAQSSGVHKIEKEKEHMLFSELIADVKRRKLSSNNHQDQSPVLREQEMNRTDSRDIPSSKEEFHSTYPRPSPSKRPVSDATRFPPDSNGLERRGGEELKVPETIPSDVFVPETINLVESSVEVEDSEDDEDDFVIPSQLHRRPKLRRSSRRVTSQSS